jgi:hypothetical protein
LTSTKKPSLAQSCRHACGGYSVGARTQLCHHSISFDQRLVSSIISKASTDIATRSLVFVLQPETVSKPVDKQQPKAENHAAAKRRSSDGGAAKKAAAAAPASKQQKQHPGSSEKQQQDKKPPQKAAAAAPAAKKPAGKAAAAAANGAAAAAVKKEQAARAKKEFDLPGQTRETPDEVNTAGVATACMFKAKEVAV